MTMENRKRKRDQETDAPRIKYHVEQLGRSFERILKEESHEELRNVVRKKLNLDATARLELVQLREGRLYDLEDDDDFEAFKAAAVAYSSLDVRVSFSPQDVASATGHADVSSTTGASESRDVSTIPNQDRRKKSKKRVSAPAGSIRDETMAPSQSAAGTHSATTPGDEADMPPPPKKKRKKGGADVVVEAPGGSSKAKGSSKSKDPDPIPADDQDQEPPKKKQKKNKVADASFLPQDEAAPSVAAVAAPTKKAKSRKNKAAEADTIASPQDIPSRPTEKKDVQPLVSTVANSDASASASSASPARAVAPARDAQPLSPASRIKSTFFELQSRPSPTAEEILASFENKRAAATKKKETASSSSIKGGKEKEKLQAKASVGKSHLSKSWIPEDSERPSPVLRADSSPPSGSAPPPLAGTAVPLAAAVISTPAAAIIDNPVIHLSHTKPPKSPSKQAYAPSCPVCLLRPFHLRYLCPTIKLGGSAIKKRIVELEAEGGRDDLVRELNDWLNRERKGKKADKTQVDTDIEPAVNDADQSPSLKSVFAWAPKAGRKRDSPQLSVSALSSSPRNGQLSEVTVESHGEGSEDESSTSDSNSSSEDEKDDEISHLNTAETESESESESSGSSLESATNGVMRSPSIDLDDVDLEEVIRGPTVKIQLSKLGEESDSTEENLGLFEEEEEEERPRRTKSWKVNRSSSPEDVRDDEDQESEAEPEPERSVAVDEVNFSIGDEGSDTRASSQGNAGTVVGSSAGVDSNVSPTSKSELQLDSGPPSLVSQEVEAIPDADIAISHPPKTPPTEAPSKSTSTILPPTTPTRSPAHRAGTTFRSPLIKQMKDRSGNLPLNPPDDEIGPVLSVLPVDDNSSIPIPEEEVEQPQRGRSRARSQARSTVTRSRSRTAGPPTTSSAVSTPTQPDGAPKRRGRPPLTEAIKAERKAIKDAEKAARAAEKRAKMEEKKKVNKTPVPRNTRTKSGDPEAVPLGSEADRALESTPALGSQWKPLALPTGSSVASRSSPAVDQLVSSSPAAESKGGHADLEGAMLPRGVSGIKSPGAVSVTTSASLRHDEDDVEKIIGSPKARAFDKQKILPSLRQPLFLPGASQMTQTQSIPHVLDHQADEQAPNPPDHQSDSGSSSDTEAESDEGKRTPQKVAIPRPSVPSKSAFPSLSQLSFDKFRPSFLLPGRGLSQHEEKKQDAQLDDESESDDEESSDEEKHSHIPKGRLAGTGVVRQRKSRGLLHA